MNRSFLAKPVTLAATFSVLAAALFVADRASSLVEEREQQLQRRVLLAHAGAASARLEGEIRGTFQLSRGIAVFASARPDAPLSDFAPLAHGMLREDPHIRAVSVERTGEPPLVAVRDGQSLPGPPGGTAWNEASGRALDTRQTVLFTLPFPDAALVQLSPVFVNERLWGWTRIVIPLDPMLEAAGLRPGADAHFALRSSNPETGRSVPLFGPPELFHSDAVTLPVTLPGATWELAARPAEGWMSESRLRVIAFAVALFVSLLTYVLLAEREREKHLALHDTLTGLPNRLFFDMRLEHAISRAERHGRAFALLYLDLDDFKPVNDVHGHKAGDRVLIETGRRIRRNLRRVDTVARIGGDEFMVILDDTSGPAEAEVVAYKLIQALRTPIIAGAHEVRVGVSIGASFYPASGRTPDELIRRADQAMYCAKSKGKNRCCSDALIAAA